MRIFTYIFDIAHQRKGIIMQKKKSSEELLKDSAIELLSKSPVNKVTVNMICNNCGISQRTFYNYYKDKNDLVTSVYTGIIDEFFNAGGSDVTFHDLAMALVSSIYEYGDFYISVIRYTGQNNFRGSIHQPMKDAAIRMITEVFGDEITQDISDALDIYLFGCIGYMEYHLLHGHVIPAEITVPIFEKSIPSNLIKYL